jgi:hypothetical protein
MRLLIMYIAVYEAYHCRHFINANKTDGIQRNYEMINAMQEIKNPTEKVSCKLQQPLARMRGLLNLGPIASRAMGTGDLRIAHCKGTW